MCIRDRQKDGTKYFQDKANTDKKRYLKEQENFYNEVELIHQTQNPNPSQTSQPKPEIKIPILK